MIPREPLMTYIHLCPKCGKPTESQGEGLVRCFHCSRTMRVETARLGEAEEEAPDEAPPPAAGAALEVAPAVPETPLMQIAFLLGVAAVVFLGCAGLLMRRPAEEEQKPEGGSL